MPTFKKIFLLIITAVILLTPILVLAASEKAPPDRYGIEETMEKTSLQKISITSKYKGNLPALIGDIVAAGLTLIGVVFFILILYGGIYWMTAMGRTEQAEKAKEILEKAIVGLVIVGASYAISNFIFSSLASKGVGAGREKSDGGCCYYNPQETPNYFCNPSVVETECANGGDTYVTNCNQCQ